MCKAIYSSKTRKLHITTNLQVYTTQFTNKLKLNIVLIESNSSPIPNPKIYQARAQHCPKILKKHQAKAQHCPNQRHQAKAQHLPVTTYRIPRI